MSNKNKKPGKNSTWINDLNHKHQEELSRVVHKMQVVPLGLKWVKLSEINNFKSNWQYVQHKVNDKREENIVNDPWAETLKEVKKRTELKYENKTHIVITNESKVVVQKEKESKQIKLK